MPDIDIADLSDHSAYLRETTRLKQRVAELEARQIVLVADFYRRINAAQVALSQSELEAKRLRAEKTWLTSRVTTLESDRTTLAEHIGEDQAVEIILAADAVKGGP